MADVFKPPHAPIYREGVPSLFLAGSIDMGRAEPWQKQVEMVLASEEVILLNPRRDDWDSSWTQTIHNPDFRKQVEWELDGLERADLILMYFVAGTQAPVTLLEMGLSARSGKVLTVCPPGYWRRGNVEIICKRFDIPLYRDLESALLAIRSRLRSFVDKI